MSSIDQILDSLVRYTILDRDIGRLSVEEIEYEKSKLRELVNRMLERGRINLVVPVVPQGPWPPHILLYQKLSEVLYSDANRYNVHIVLLESFLKSHSSYILPRPTAIEQQKTLMKVLGIDVDGMIAKNRMIFKIDADLIDFYHSYKLSDEFKNIVNSINIETFYEKYLKIYGAGFYRYYSKSLEGARGTLVIDFMSMLSLIFYTIEDAGGGIIIVGEDKKHIIKYLLDLAIEKSSVIAEGIRKGMIYILYLPEIEAFYKIREHEPQLPGPNDSIDVIKRRLSHCEKNDIDILVKLHILRNENTMKRYFGSTNIDIDKMSRDFLIEKLARFYFDIYREMEKIAPTAPLECCSDDEETIKLLKVLANETRFRILKSIYRIYSRKLEGVKISEIQERLRDDYNEEIPRSTIEYNIKFLVDLGLIDVSQDETGAKIYKPRYSEIIIKIIRK